MSDKKETVGSIIKDMYGPKFYPWGQGGFSVEMDLTPLARRLAAAYKREICTEAPKCEPNWEAIKCPCNFCKEYLGWVHIRRSDGIWVDRPWCRKSNSVCLPQENGCKQEGGAK